MTSRLPAVRGDAVIAALRRAGFYVHHIKGSHHVLRHLDKPAVRVIVPVHRKDLPVGTLRSIITQSKLSIEEFLNLL
jgi:predicted RNA binding protein YcfA (HicA-like mRNA interferase family)